MLLILRLLCLLILLLRLAACHAALGLRMDMDRQEQISIEITMTNGDHAFDKLELQIDKRNTIAGVKDQFKQHYTKMNLLR